MDKIVEQINALNIKVLNLIEDVEEWLEETEPEVKEHDAK